MTVVRVKIFGYLTCKGDRACREKVQCCLCDGPGAVVEVA
jgi:hypothetical protein